MTFNFKLFFIFMLKFIGEIINIIKVFKKTKQKDKHFVGKYITV